MRKIIIMAAFFIIACNPNVISIGHFPERQTSVVIDFSPYSKDGFLFTPHGYDGEYKSIGLVQYSLRTEADYTTYSKDNPLRNVLAGITGEWSFRKISIDQVLQTAYNEAKYMGGDAIIDVEITVSSEETLYSNLGHTVNIPLITLSGFAIKRLNRN